MSAEERPIPEGLARLHDDIISRYDRLRSARTEKHLYEALPEACRTGCTIARVVIDQLLNEGANSGSVFERLGECPANPQVVGECSTQKNVCSHPESGDSDNFNAQINSLFDYVQGKNT